MNPTLTIADLQTKLKNTNDVTGFLREIITPEMLAKLSTEQEGEKKGIGRGRWRRKALSEETTQEAPTAPAPKKKLSLSTRKYETVDDPLEEKIIALYARGLTTRDICAYLRDIDGISMVQEKISSITDKVLPLVREWQVRPLARLYPILYLDGVHFKVRDSGKIVNRCAYVLLGINEEGYKELLGIWIGATEGSKFWMQVLTEIKNRGVEDVLLCCIDGLKGFSDAIKTIFPEAIIQQCIVHQIRHTVKFVSHKHRKAFCEDLKKIYMAPSEEAGLDALQEVKRAWPQFALSLRSWETKWAELATFFQYPEQLRHIIYTNNAIENLNRQFRKVTKTSQVFPHDDALQKLLWLAQYDISRQWTFPIHRWGEVLTQLAILFPEKIAL
ncbi:MAG: IS256 family transposase [Candidatus Peribacteraceae bacterium]|nr:IS256 family transposase [Candidatus Peribacteraceae bacterium]